MTATVHSLYVYPIKSCGGISLKNAELIRTGFRHDRHWMLVNKQGGFLSQRTLPRMALIETQIIDNRVLLCSAAGNQLEIPLHTSDEDRLPVQIWNDNCSAARVSPEVSRWFSEFLDVDCELVFLPDTEKRPLDRDYASDDQTIAFADGFPVLVVSLASIELLSSKLQQEVSIERFRPNIVLDGCDAHEEDSWRSITINGIPVQLAKPCSRCVIPGIDPDTAQKHPTLLKTLASYRRFNGKVYVGQNGLHGKHGHISVGQSVSVEKT